MIGQILIFENGAVSFPNLFPMGHPRALEIMRLIQEQVDEQRKATAA